MALLPDAALLYTGAAPPAALARKRDPMRPSLQILFLPLPLPLTLTLTLKLV